MILDRLPAAILSSPLHVVSFRLILLVACPPSSFGLPPRPNFFTGSYMAKILNIHSCPVSYLGAVLTVFNKYLVLSCPVCTFRHPLRKFEKELAPILFPLGFACSRGRARVFITVERLPWSALPSLRHTRAWESVLGVYRRLAAAYDHFYETCGFLSPRMTALVEELRARLSYPDAYLTTGSPSYVKAYVDTHADMASAYNGGDYSETYAVLMNQFEEVL